MHYLPETGPAGRTSSYRQMARLLQYRAVRVTPVAGLRRRLGCPRCLGTEGLRAGPPGRRGMTALEVSCLASLVALSNPFLASALLPQVSLTEELLSPVLAPLFLLFWFRPGALEIDLS